MTVSTTISKSGPYAGAGTTGPFLVNFRFLEDTHLQVIRTDSSGVDSTLTITVDYIVSGEGDETGMVMLSDPLLVGEKLTIIRNVPATQEADYVQNDRFPAESHERALDKLTMLVQQNGEVLERSLKFPATDPSVGTQLPNADDRKGRVLAFHEVTGEPVQGPSIADVGTVAGNIVSVNTVANNIADVVTVADNISDVNAVASNIADVNTVASNIADVVAVGSNITDVQTVADNIVDVSNFAGVYYGPSATDPATRRDGSPLQDGDLYFNTTSNSLRTYSASTGVWVEGASGAVNVYNFDGDGSETTFTLPISPANENVTQVYISGVYQQKNVYDVVGTDLIFDAAPPVGVNNIEVVTFSVLPIGVTDASLVSFPGGKSVADLAAPGGASMVADVSQVVSSVTELRALKNDTPSKFARTTGYHAPEDGGAAFYYLDESDTTSPDNGVTVIVASDGGRWKLNHNGTINVRQAGARGDGSDDIAALQRAADALSSGMRLVAEGEFTTSEELWIRKSNVVYDFRAAKFIQTGTTYTGYGAGVIIGDSQSPTTVPTNITLLGGEYRPAGNSQPYPLADYTPIAVIAGHHITILNPRIYPKQSTRAISVQTDSTYGDGVNPAIDGVYVYGLEVYGDGDAVDGVDVTSDGRDDLIRNVFIQGQVFGCKRGFNVSPGSDSYNFRGINIDLIVDGATEVAGNISRCINSNVKLRAKNCWKTGVDARQLASCYIDAKLHGVGGGLLNAFALVDGIGTAQNVIDVQASGAWSAGVYAGSEFAVYRNVEVDGAALGIKTLGFRTTWNDVVLRNCTTDIDNPHLATDVWGSVVTQKTGDSPRKRGMTIGANNGVDQFYSMDLAGGETIVIPASGEALPLGNVATFSGMLLVNGVAGMGDPGLFLCGGALTYFLGGSSASYSNIESNPGTVNIYYNADMVIEIKNNTAGSVTLRVMSVRMRNSP